MGNRVLWILWQLTAANGDLLDLFYIILFLKYDVLVNYEKKTEIILYLLCLIIIINVLLLLLLCYDINVIYY